MIVFDISISIVHGVSFILGMIWKYNCIIEKPKSFHMPCQFWLSSLIWVHGKFAYKVICLPHHQDENYIIFKVRAHISWVSTKFNMHLFYSKSSRIVILPDCRYGSYSLNL